MGNLWRFYHPCLLLRLLCLGTRLQNADICCMLNAILQFACCMQSQIPAAQHQGKDRRGARQDGARCGPGHPWGVAQIPCRNFPHDMVLFPPAQVHLLPPLTPAAAPVRRSRWGHAALQQQHRPRQLHPHHWRLYKLAPPPLQAGKESWAS